MSDHVHYYVVGKYERREYGESGIISSVLKVNDLELTEKSFLMMRKNFQKRYNLKSFIILNIIKLDCDCENE